MSEGKKCSRRLPVWNSGESFFRPLISVDVELGMHDMVVFVEPSIRVRKCCPYLSLSHHDNDEAANEFRTSLNALRIPHYIRIVKW